MLCPKCKEQLKDGTKICPFCGTDIKAALSACTAQANLSGRPQSYTKSGIWCAYIGFILSVSSILLCFTLLPQVSAMVLCHIGAKHTVTSGRPHKFAKAGNGIAIFMIAFFVFSVVVIAGGYFLLKNIFSIWG